MWKWVLRIVVVAVCGFVGFSIYEIYRGGYFSLPDLQENEYPISFKNGLRAILIDPEVTTDLYADAPKLFRRLHTANEDRIYLGVPAQVPHWLEDVWSYCPAPKDEEKASIGSSMTVEWQEVLEYARLEGVCSIDVEGEKVPRGLVYSRPKL